MSSGLFAERDRDDHDPGRYNEPTFAFLDRRAGDKWQRVRDLLDEWFDSVPERARADLRNRLQSGNPVDFRSAFFELYCQAILRRGGFDLALHPHLAHTRRRPDMQASRDSLIIFVEVTTTSQHLIFEAYPLASGHYGPGGRIIGTFRPAEAQHIDDVTPLRKRITSKATAYGNLNAPFVIAVDAVGDFTDDHDFLSAFYGKLAIKYYQNVGHAGPPPVAIRLFDGLWARPDGWRQTQVSAILATTKVMPWTITSTTPTLWHHPGADLPVGDICPLLRQARLDPANQRITYSGPELTPHEFFGLPQNWPDSPR